MKVREMAELCAKCDPESDAMWLNEEGVLEKVDEHFICESNGTLYIGVDEQAIEDVEEQEDAEIS